MHSVQPPDGLTDFDNKKFNAFLGENYLVTFHKEESPSVQKALKYCIADSKVVPGK